MLVDYTVVHSEFVTTLKQMILNAAAEGWQLVGGISVTQDRAFKYTYFQALAKYENA